MKLEINIEKKHFWILLSLIILIPSTIMVYAYTSSIPDPGHGADTVWVETPLGEKTLQAAIDDGDILDLDINTQCDTAGSCNQLCVGTDCVSNWGVEGTDGSIQCQWEYISCNNGGTLTCSSDEWWINRIRVKARSNQDGDNQCIDEIYCCHYL